METRIYIRALNAKEDSRIPFYWAQEFVVTDAEGETAVIRGFENHCMFRPLEVKANMAGWSNIGKGDEKKFVAKTTMPDHVSKQVLFMMMVHQAEIAGRDFTVVCSDCGDPSIEWGESKQQKWEALLKEMKENATPYENLPYGGGNTEKAAPATKMDINALRKAKREQNS